MPNLVDRIERYIKRILEQNPEGFIVIQRSELASEFECAPSQINYVLSTRFSNDQGYLVESRRGGGGYLRIIKLELQVQDQLSKTTRQFGSGELSQNASDGMLRRLREEDLLTQREVMLIRAMLDRDTLALPVRERDFLRGRLLAAVLTTLAREDF
ncbi:MAG TPA: CtsR family transcriptional regulator [Candidatus Deferrimicrobium sp.]|nr:CtsR family transcriptional regulator [Candidatus Deferrimicrobium sp.]